MFKIKESFRLISYCDENYASDKVERKSTGGSCHFIGGNLVTWICKKQGSIALSTDSDVYAWRFFCTYTTTSTTTSTCVSRPSTTTLYPLFHNILYLYHLLLNLIHHRLLRTDNDVHQSFYL